MFIFTSVFVTFIVYITVKYSESIQKLIGIYVDDNDVVEDDIIYGKHPMSDDDDEYTSDDEDDELDDYLEDFYEETTLTDEWMEKTDEEKREILDREIDEYMYQKKHMKNVETHLKNIKC